MGKVRRHVGRTKRLQSPLSVAFIKKQFRKSNCGGAIARIVLDQRLADRPCAKRLTVAHEEPHRRQKELPLVSSHCFLGGLSRNTVTTIFSY